MKIRYYSLLFLLIFANCTSQKNSETFIKEASGRYLFNDNEVLEVYFEEQLLFVKWRGNDHIEPLKVNDSSFYMKELNEKMMFVSAPLMHIELTPKREHKGIIFHFKKIKNEEKTASEYLLEKEYHKALNSFLLIQKKDSLSPTIRERYLNRLGYDYIQRKDYKTAIEIFKIVTKLYPKSANTFDSLADAYLKHQDTVNAVRNYEKALAINPENRGSNRSLRKIKEK
jgi:tetratricopeptide (TPR) repeat protein